MVRLGIENISVFGLPRVELVNLSADLGCQHISIGVISFGGYSRKIQRVRPGLDYLNAAGGVGVASKCFERRDHRDTYGVPQS